MSDRPARYVAVLASMAALLAAAPVAAGSREDPTRPPVAARDAGQEGTSGGSDPLVLQAVFHAEGRRVAIINDQRVGVGDRVRAARVVAIDRDAVTLRRAGETIALELVPRDVKRPSPAPASPAVSPTASREEARKPVAPADRGEPVEPGRNASPTPAHVEGIEQ